MNDAPNPVMTRSPKKYWVVDADSVFGEQGKDGEYCDTPDEAFAAARRMAAQFPGHCIDVYHHATVVYCRPQEPETKG